MKIDFEFDDDHIVGITIFLCVTALAALLCAYNVSYLAFGYTQVYYPTNNVILWVKPEPQ